jgi:hypothetical protein
MTEERDDKELLDWERVEERCAKLIRLGGDPRTPEHERNAACRKVVEMFRKGDMEVTSTGRWEAVTVLVQGLLRGASDLHQATGRDACQGPLNLGGKNGWRCCRCRAFNVQIVVTLRGSDPDPTPCRQCGHHRCDGLRTDPAWDPHYGTQEPQEAPIPRRRRAR